MDNGGQISRHLPPGGATRHLRVAATRTARGAVPPSYSATLMTYSAQ
jgi:hypothetical protein